MSNFLLFIFIKNDIVGQLLITKVDYVPDRGTHDFDLGLNDRPNMTIYSRTSTGRSPLEP